MNGSRDRRKKRKPYATHRYGPKPISAKKHAAAVKFSAPFKPAPDIWDMLREAEKSAPPSDGPFRNSWLDEALGETEK